MIKNPIKTDLTLKCKKKLLGGGPGDDIIISKFLNNKIYNVIETTNKITFTIPLDINSNETPDGNYLGSGWNTTVIAIDCVQEQEYPRSVLKVTAINKDHSKELSYYDEWDDGFYLTHYVLMKSQFNIIVPTIYFYGNRIRHECDIMEDILEDTDENYNAFLRNKMLIFNISEYYNNILNLNYTVIEEFKNVKCIYLMKLIGILIYMLSMDYMIYDLKYDNIGIDRNNNVVIIDYDFRTFYPFKTDGQYMYYKYSVGAHTPCYVIKLIYSYIKNNLQDIFNHKFYKNSHLNDYLVGNINYLIFMRDHVPNIRNTNIGFEKISSLAIAEIILNIFFKEYYYINSTTGYLQKSKLKNFAYGSTLINSTSVELELNRIKYVYNPDDRQSYAEKMSTFENLNDIGKITKFIYEFIEPLDGHGEYCRFLQRLLFDPESETGLFAPEEDDVPTYEMVFKYFYEMQKTINRGKHGSSIAEIFETFMVLIRQNIKLDVVYTGSFDSQTYEEWVLSRIEHKTTSSKLCELIPQDTRFVNFYKEFPAPVSIPKNTGSEEKTWERGKTPMVISRPVDAKTPTVISRPVDAKTWKRGDIVQSNETIPIDPNYTTALNNKTKLGGHYKKDKHYYKYIKYKLKYIELKNKNNQN